MNVGVASHITAAAPGGARYDPSLSVEARAGQENGIWLCQTCAHLVDSDEAHYSATLLKGWRAVAEETARIEIETRGAAAQSRAARFARLDGLMPELVAEMRKDITETPTLREVVLMRHGNHYWGRGEILVYYYDEHPNLDQLMRILEGEGFVRDISTGHTRKFVISEDFADYLCTPRLGAD